MNNFPKFNFNKVLNAVLLLVIALIVAEVVYAATPNPGHLYTESSGGVVLGDIIYGSGFDTLLKLSGAAGFLKSTGAAAPAWSAINLAASADVGTSILPVANGGTGLAATADDAVFVGDSASAVTARTLPTCSGATTDKLLYNISTNSFSCGTDQTGGGSTMTTVTTKNASGLGTGANAAVAMTSLTARKVALFTIPYSITVNQLTYNVGAVTTAGTIRFCVYNEAGSSKLIDVTDVPAAGANPVTVGAVTLTPGNYYIAFGCATTCSNTVFMFTSTANTVVNTSAVPTGKKEYEGLYTMTSGTCNTTIDPTAFTGTISHTPVVRLDN